MGFNPSVRDVMASANEDRRWIATLMGYDQCRSITLDLSTFEADHLTKKGALPSGLVLAKLAGGKYGPYNGAGASGSAESVSIAATGTVSGGTFTLTFDGETTSAIAWNANAATIAAALKALSNVGANDVVVTGGPSPTTFVVTFAGDLAGANVSDLTVDSGSLTGGGSLGATVTQGAGGQGSGLAQGFLFNSVPMVQYMGAAVDLSALPDVGATLYWGPGIIDQDKLPTFATATTGLLNAAAREQLGAHLRFEGTNL